MTFAECRVPTTLSDVTLSPCLRDQHVLPAPPPPRRPLDAPRGPPHPHVPLGNRFPRPLPEAWASDRHRRHHGPLSAPRAQRGGRVTDRVPGLGRDAAEQLAAQRIAERLGDHPLALDQAAHRLGDTRAPAAAYLTEQGHPDQAEPLAARETHIRTARILGADHPDTIRAKQTLAEAANRPALDQSARAENPPSPNTGTPASAPDNQPVQTPVNASERPGRIIWLGSRTVLLVVEDTPESGQPVEQTLPRIRLLPHQLRQLPLG